MKIKGKYALAVELDGKEIEAIQNAVDILADIIYTMDDKGCEYLSYSRNKHGEYSYDYLDSIKEELLNIAFIDSIYREGE